MVTLLLRPHRHAHGPAAVDVRRLLRTSSSLQPPSPSSSPSSWCWCCWYRRCSDGLRSMAQDPSHPHRQSKDTAEPPPQQQQQQPEQPELIIAAQQQALPPPPPQPHPQQQQHPPPRDVVVQEPSTSSTSSGGGTDAGLSLQLGLGPSPGSPSTSRRKRPRTDVLHEAAAGPSTSSRPATAAAADPELRLSVHPAGPSSSSSPAAASSSSSVGSVVAAAPPPPAHEAGTWFVLRAAQNQRREPPPLPQITRSFLRVRDGRMTVRVVMRYLVNKLGLEDDSQVWYCCIAPYLIQFEKGKNMLRHVVILCFIL
ncbi:protein LAX PANICLE 2-like isoform X2 [Oryza brachyantha]|uniref:protein LAX PANICLE 2-like isoform X2 n=1 Tax=Oryza brachyantha TaxID=4533 RepID=UPI001ADD3B5E|nr:protein LAX PANICLE 2-like isoform X2 [Oryza brachyantha]